MPNRFPRWARVLLSVLNESLPHHGKLLLQVGDGVLLVLLQLGPMPTPQQFS